jgi:glycolate oxidase iron-sulfur subunit
MQHAIPAGELGVHGEAMSEVVESCVHCGFCLPACPTYMALEEELDSPRGRIFLMKEVLEGELELEAALPFVDACLGCQACQTSCPSGVRYEELLTPFRMQAEERRQRSVGDRARRALVLRTLPHPRRFRVMAQLGRLARPLSGRLPKGMSTMLELIPDRIPRARPLPPVHPAQGPRRARVALLAGCAQQVLDPDVNWATLDVLARNGVETVIPCCGSLAMHAGAAEPARSVARRNLAAFSGDFDAVLTNAAGCGSGMRDYGLLFRGCPEQTGAEELADRVVDVSVFLDRLGLREPPPLPVATRLVYQDACHLAHAQAVRCEPRRLLASIGNLTLAEPAEGDVCCGSAGIYNVEQPEIAAELGQRKARKLMATHADLIASGNIGCMTQLRRHLRDLGSGIPVLHTMQVLALAYRGELRWSGR